MTTDARTLDTGRRRVIHPLRPGLHPLWPVLATALWIATLGNLALWRALYQYGLLQGWNGFIFAIGLGTALAALLVVLLGLLAWRRTLRPALVAALVTSAVATHFMLGYGVVIDRAMLVNVAQTHAAEAADLMTPSLLLTVSMLGLLPAWWTWRIPIATRPWPGQLRHNLLAAGAAAAVAVLALLAVFQPLSSAVREHRPLRYLVNPLNTVVAAAQVVAAQLKAAPQPLRPLGRDAAVAPPSSARRPPLLVLVLGETARADHFGLNGYALDTTPELAVLGVVSQRQARSCGTSTAASVPCMFSHMSRTEFDGATARHESLVDVLHHAGLAVLWLDNQAGCKGVCDRVPNVNTSKLGDNALCADGECRDEVMLSDLDARIASMPADRRARGIVLVMHQMGSHGPAYYKRYSAAFKRFRPECRSAALQDCSREEVVNAYDNTIAYTDHFLAATIHWLQAKSDQADTALLYVSDHGESLGEHNLYLHGLPYAMAPDTQKHVPWITWMSPGFALRTGVTRACLQQRLDEPVSHDHYFHSVLGLLDVQTQAYRPERDFYRACRSP